MRQYLVCVFQASEDDSDDSDVEDDEDEEDPEDEIVATQNTGTSEANATGNIYVHNSESQDEITGI